MAGVEAWPNATVTTRTSSSGLGSRKLKTLKYHSKRLDMSKKIVNVKNLVLIA
jgi:hypothetical protein